MKSKYTTHTGHNDINPVCSDINFVPTRAPKHPKHSGAEGMPREKAMRMEGKNGVEAISGRKGKH